MAVAEADGNYPGMKSVVWWVVAMLELLVVFVSDRSRWCMHRLQRLLCNDRRACAYVCRSAPQEVQRLGLGEDEEREGGVVLECLAKYRERWSKHETAAYDALCAIYPSKSNQTHKQDMLCDVADSLDSCTDGRGFCLLLHM